MLDHSWIQYVPFFSLVTGRQQSPLIARLLEAALISGVGGLVGVYVGMEVIKADMNFLKQGQAEISHRVEQVDSKVEQLRRDLYVPRAGGNK